MVDPNSRSLKAASVQGVGVGEGKDLFLWILAHGNSWQMARKRKIGLRKSTTQTKNHSVPLTLQGNTDSQWTSLANLNSLDTVAISSIRHFQRPHDQPAISWQIGTTLEHFREPFSKPFDLESIVLLCSLHTFSSQRFWEPIVPSH